MSKDQVKFRGKLPYGYCENDEGKIIRDRFEVKVYSRIVSMYLKGKSMRQIAAALENDKIPTRLMKGEWSPGVISQILGHRAYYKGEIEMRSKKAEAGIIIFKCKPIITKERWYKIQDRIDKKRRGSDRSGSNADEFLLHKRLKCGVCGNTLSTRYQNEKGFYYCRWNRCSNAELESHNKSERCTLQPIRAREIEQHVYGLLMAYICGEAYGIGFISAKRIERSLDPAKWNDKIKQLEAKISYLNEKRADAKKVLEQVQEILNREPYGFSSCASVLDTALARNKELDAKLLDAHAERDAYLKKREVNSLLLAFRQNPPATLAKIHQSLMALPLEKKQKLIEGMLSGEKKIKVWIPGDDYYLEAPERPESNWTEGMDENEVEYYTYPEEKLTWRDGLSPEWSFDPEVLQEVLPEELNVELNMNSNNSH